MLTPIQALRYVRSLSNDSDADIEALEKSLDWTPGETYPQVDTLIMNQVKRGFLHLYLPDMPSPVFDYYEKLGFGTDYKEQLIHWMYELVQQ